MRSVVCRRRHCIVSQRINSNGKRNREEAQQQRRLKREKRGKMENRKIRYQLDRLPIVLFLACLVVSVVAGSVLRSQKEAPFNWEISSAQSTDSSFRFLFWHIILFESRGKSLGKTPHSLSRLVLEFFISFFFLSFDICVYPFWLCYVLSLSLPVTN